MVFLVVFIIFVLFFLWSSCRSRLEGFEQDRALPHRVVALGVDWTPFVMKDLVELILQFFSLFTTRGAIHSTDYVIRLVYTRRISLVAGPSTVVVALPIVVVVAAWEAAASLLLFVCAALHHVSYLHYHFGVITPKVTVQRLDGDAAMEVVDDVIVGDVGDSGSCVEEALDVGSDRFGLFLLAHRQGMSGSYSM